MFFLYTIFLNTNNVCLLLKEDFLEILFYDRNQVDHKITCGLESQSKTFWFSYFQLIMTENIGTI